jgi:hypothetical protein
MNLPFLKKSFNYAKYQETGTQKFIGLIGQSNATGAMLNSGLPSDLAGIIPNAYIYDLVSGTYQQLQNNINNRQDISLPGNNGAFGIEMRLMKLLGSYYSTPQYMFKYCYVGTQLYNNNATCWNVFCTPVSLWVNSFAKCAEATSKLPIASKNLQWLIWIQGENDCNATSAAAYQQNLTDVINFTRSSTGLSTNLKFILVSLATTQTSLNATYSAQISTAMSTIAGSLTNVFFISQNSSVQGDNTHYDAAGYDNIATLVYNVIIAN